MKKIHIVLLVLIAGAIAVLITFLKSASTYETVAQAKSTPDKFVHVAVVLDKAHPLEYDAKKDPNYLSFHAIDAEDSTQTMKVVYRKGDRQDLMMAQRLVLKGKFKDDHFECVDIQTKCPSKYKDDMTVAGKELQKSTETRPTDYSPSTNN